MKELIAKREELAAELDAALANKQEATAAHREAKDAVLAFDNAHPEVMREINFAAGQAKQAAVRAAAEAEANVTAAGSAEAEE